MTEPLPAGHRRSGPFTPRRLAAGGAVLLAAVTGTALLLQNGGSACAAPPSTSASEGKATFYDLGGGQGNCSFPSSPTDDLFVALGPEQYSAGAACGTYLDVSGPKGSVRVKVTDSCPECEAGHLDLSRTAFKKIGAEVDGIIPITYRTVARPSVPAPISVRIKEGASQYWFAALIDNHGSALESVTVGGRKAHREPYNYWVIDGGAGPGPYTIKILDVYGRSATLDGIDMSPGEIQKTSATLAGNVSSATKATPAAKTSVKPSAASPSRSVARSKPKPAAARPTPPSSAPAASSPPAPVREKVDLAAGTARCG